MQRDGVRVPMYPDEPDTPCAYTILQQGATLSRFAVTLGEDNAVTDAAEQSTNAYLLQGQPPKSA
jgi:hypothetical protein